MEGISGAEVPLSPVSGVGEMDNSSVSSEAVGRRKKDGNRMETAFR